MFKRIGNIVSIILDRKLSETDKDFLLKIAKEYKGNFSGVGPIFYAVMHGGSVSVLEGLFNLGSTITIENPTGQNHIAHYLLSTALEMQAPQEVIELLLNKGIEIENNAKDENGVRIYGKDSLAIALRSQYTEETLGLLVKNGAIANTYCLHEALMQRTPSKNIIEFLLSSGANIENDARDGSNARNHYGDSLYIALQHNVSQEIIDLLLIYGADPALLPDDREEKPDLVQRKSNLLAPEYDRVSQIGSYLHLKDGLPNELAEIIAIKSFRYPNQDEEKIAKAAGHGVKKAKEILSKRSGDATEQTEAVNKGCHYRV